MEFNAWIKAPKFNLGRWHDIYEATTYKTFRWMGTGKWSFNIPKDESNDQPEIVGELDLGPEPFSDDRWFSFLYGVYVFHVCPKRGWEPSEFVFTGGKHWDEDED